MANFLKTRAKIKANLAAKRRRASDDTPPLVKLLRGARADGSVEVEYDAQHRTYFKALRNGHIADTSPHATITDKGRAYLAAHYSK